MECGVDGGGCERRICQCLRRGGISKVRGASQVVWVACVIQHVRSFIINFWIAWILSQCLELQDRKGCFLRLEIYK